MITLSESILTKLSKIVLLEWRSFRKSFPLLLQTTASNYQKIIFRPEYFLEILLDKVFIQSGSSIRVSFIILIVDLQTHLIFLIVQVGFRTVEDLTSNLSGTKTGFNRSIFAFRK